jgi:nucleoside 2-deoxyribosyltransferase
VTRWTAASHTLSREGADADQTKIFLGGPIQYLSSYGNSSAVIADHREIFQAFVTAGFHVFSAHECERYGEDSHCFSPADVTARDLAWAKACDIYVGILPLDDHGQPYRSDGTHIEIGWATALGKKVVLLLDDSATRPYSHLVLGLVENLQASAVQLSRWRDDLIPCVAGMHALG